MKWFNYTSRHAAGTIECPPQFYDFPEKWPIRNNEPMMLGYSRKTELVLSLEVLGYMKDKRVRNDKIFLHPIIRQRWTANGRYQRGLCDEKRPFP